MPLLEPLTLHQVVLVPSQSSVLPDERSVVFMGINVDHYVTNLGVHNFLSLLVQAYIPDKGYASKNTRYLVY